MPEGIIHTLKTIVNCNLNGELARPHVRSVRDLALDWQLRAGRPCGFATFGPQHTGCIHCYLFCLVNAHASAIHADCATAILFMTVRKSLLKITEIICSHPVARSFDTQSHTRTPAPNLCPCTRQPHAQNAMHKRDINQSEVPGPPSRW